MKAKSFVLAGSRFSCV